ncbi:ABC transporter ATP-binding protein [Sporomusa malonica]|uniref:Nickel import system ATP-binding protein NikD n=1 Tax=Sporomusa malonica TaxID=112901 RepID=A0A1W2F3T6_9FIRM|nr:ABC transporter ATP-binding protein [Sporomusa malonica]SMD16611.1 peptide/nickel transport system ATP-binding protein [Sporomusa malonica]
MNMLEVNDLSISFIQYSNGLRQKNIRVISDLNVAIKTGEVLAAVGASGSGKSLLAHAILGILPNNSRMTGTIKYNGEVLTPERQADLRGKEIALVPQSVNYLDPLMQVGAQVRNGSKNKEAVIAQREVFSRYNLASHVERLFPFQLSGGMARRVLVSTAIVSGARLVIADEPTPGLDAVAVKETLDFFRELANQGCAVMVITHDIETALKIADRIAVFYAGTTVEIASAEDFAGQGDELRHPYSKALWQALPQNRFEPIDGFQPSSNELHGGCLFAPRCSIATSRCASVLPAAREVRQGMVRCIYAS